RPTSPHLTLPCLSLHTPPPTALSPLSLHDALPISRYERPLFNTGMVTLTGHPEQGWQLEDWASEPVGGAHLLGDTSHDVTADSTADAAEPAEAADPVV